MTLEDISQHASTLSDYELETLIRKLTAIYCEQHVSDNDLIYRDHNTVDDRAKFVIANKIIND